MGWLGVAIVFGSVAIIHTVSIILPLSLSFLPQPPPIPSPPSLAHLILRSSHFCLVHQLPTTHLSHPLSPTRHLALTSHLFHSQLRLLASPFPP